MVNERLICPYANGTPNCAVYDNLGFEINKGREDIIVKSPNGKYSCLALEAIFDLETGISVGEAYCKRISADCKECAFIESLNNQAQILKRLEELAK